MADFDVDAARRWARFDRRSTLARRADDQLPFVDPDNLSGRGLILDTCVYIDQMQGRAPELLDDLIEHRTVNHSVIAIQELMHAVGALNPSDRRTRSVVTQIGRLVKAMPSHRTFTPDADVLGRAGLLSGVLCRLQGYGKSHRMRALHDATIFLQARKLGFVVLTANTADFDPLLQLVPSGRAVFYRPVATAH